MTDTATDRKGRSARHPSTPWQPGERLVRALRVATELHAAQVRKGTQIPYLSHVLGTCAIALDYGADEDQAIAALLHDAIEDVEPVEATRATVRSFGPEVARIVEACTSAEPHGESSWRERRERYVAHLRVTDGRVLLVSASDKLHDARAIVADLRTDGPSVFERFSAPRADVLWYYRALVEAYRSNPAHHPALIDELDRTVTTIEELAGG